LTDDVVTARCDRLGVGVGYEYVVCWFDDERVWVAEDETVRCATTGVGVGYAYDLVWLGGGVCMAEVLDIFRCSDMTGVGPGYEYGLVWVGTGQVRLTAAAVVTRGDPDGAGDA
jgi:hypothetical protein